MTREREKGLKKEEIKKREELVRELDIRLEYVKYTIDMYNKSVGKANEFIQEISSLLEGYYDDRTSQWQEEDNGRNYCDFKEAWQKELQTIEIDDIDADINEFYNRDAEFLR